ncbi:CAP domain-containing protein [Leptothoe sp. ISB3NOV94-8A]
MGLNSQASTLVLAIGIILTSCGGGGGNEDKASSGTTEPPSAIENSCTTILAELFADLLTETNTIRQQNGARPLSFSYRLGRAAQAHAQNMATENYFSHRSSNGSTLADRITRVNYDYSTAGENIAAGHDSAASVVTAWFNSPGHKENLLNTTYTDIGFGLHFDSRSTYGNYWVQNFGHADSLASHDERAYIPDEGGCSIGDNIASNYTAVLNNVIVADVAPLSSSHHHQPVSTMEPTLGLGVLFAALGFSCSRKKV